MYITNEYANNVVKFVKANFKTDEKIKLLEQEERQFIVTAFKIVENVTMKACLESALEMLEDKQSDKVAKALFRSIAIKAKSKTPVERSGFFFSLFKGFSNYFFRRISSKQMMTLIQREPPQALPRNKQKK